VRGSRAGLRRSGCQPPTEKGDMKDSEILNPIREIKVGEKTVAVREMCWGDMLEFFRKISAHAGKLFTVDGAGKVKTDLTLEGLTGMITGVEELTNFLIVKSTGETAESFGGLPMGTAAEILDAALDLNTTAIKKVLALGRHFKGVGAGAAITLARPTTS